MSVVQSWVSTLPLMQQSVLLSAIRGPDGSPKYGDAKTLVRWFRRCILLGSFEQAAFTGPHELGGGSFTGPSISAWKLSRWARGLSLEEIDSHGLPRTRTELNGATDAELVRNFEKAGAPWEPLMDETVSSYLRELDALPHHFQLHLMHAAEILGYKHPEPRTRAWWFKTYERLVHDMHLWPETEQQLDARLGDTREGWLARNDAATVD